MVRTLARGMQRLALDDAGAAAVAPRGGRGPLPSLLHRHRRRGRRGGRGRHQLPFRPHNFPPPEWVVRLQTGRRGPPLPLLLVFGLCPRRRRRGIDAV